MKSYKKWTLSEQDFIRNNCILMHDALLASKLSQMTGQIITAEMVRRQRRKQQIVKKAGRPTKSGVKPLDDEGKTGQFV